MYFDLKELKYQRQRKDLTLSEFAKRINMKTTAYQKRESGKVKISIDEFAKMMEVLGISKNEILIFFKNDVDKKQQKFKTVV